MGAGSDFFQEQEEVFFGLLQQAAQQGNLGVQAALACGAVFGPTWCLEALSAARVIGTEPLVQICIEVLLRTDEPEENFAAIASIPDLPRKYWEYFRKDLELIAKFGPEDCRRAAAHLLKKMEE